MVIPQTSASSLLVYVRISVILMCKLGTSTTWSETRCMYNTQWSLGFLTSLCYMKYIILYCNCMKVGTGFLLHFLNSVDWITEPGPELKGSIYSLRPDWPVFPRFSQDSLQTCACSSNSVCVHVLNFKMRDWERGSPFVLVLKIFVENNGLEHRENFFSSPLD